MTLDEKVFSEIKRRNKASEEAYRNAIDACRGDATFDDLFSRDSALKWHFIKERNDEKRAQIENEIAGIEAKLDAYVRVRGVLTGVFDIPYFCAKCKDTGRINGELCDCFHTLKKEMQLKTNPLPNGCPAGLAAIDFSFYGQDEERKRTEAKAIEEALENGKKYFLFAGKPGTAKSYFAGAMARKMIEDGMCVFSESAVKFNKRLLEYHCSPLEKKKEIWSEFGDADVLLVDDLGAEQILNNVTVPYLTELVSERTEKITIFTTNLNPTDMSLKYGQRFVSRVLDKKLAFPMVFSGNDLRFPTTKA